MATLAPDPTRPTTPTDPDPEVWIDDDGEIITRLSDRDLVAAMPNVLTWPTEPSAKSGDEYVFTWTRIHSIDPDGNRITATVPTLAVRLTAHPIRHRRGYWRAPYVWIGLHRETYLARGGGQTGDPRRSIDPDVPIEPVQITAADRERNRKIAATRRAELAATRATRRRDRRPWTTS